MEGFITTIYYRLCDENKIKALVDRYEAFLNDLPFDEEYSVRRKKRIKKIIALCFFIACISGTLAILTSTVFIPLKKYNYAMGLISKKRYSEANDILNDTHWGDSSIQVELNVARYNFDNGNYERGICVLNNIGAEIDVSYNLKGGIGIQSNIINNLSYINNHPKKDGYIFNDWLIDSYLIGNKSDHYKTILNLDAQWGIREYSIIYELNGGVVRDNPRSNTIETNDFSLNSPSKTGYTFIGWTGTNLDRVTKEVYIPKGSFGDLEFYANWNANSYAIYLDSAGGECIMNKIDVIFDSHFELPAPAKVGYTFMGWFDDGVRWDSGIWRRISDLHLKVEWEIKN